ncbi:MAG: hypothetical protein Q7S23_04860 [bacterium]|nr:hypothetical protein [bacterium]
MTTGLEKIIAFIKRTGDRCIVLDHEGNPAYVILPLNEYERMAERRPATASVDLAADISRDAGSRGSGTPQPWGAEEPSAAGPEATAAENASDQYFFEPIE